MRQFFYLILLVPWLIGCKGVCHYPIDEEPVVKYDTSLLGMWKAIEDTDHANFFLVQNQYDVFEHKRILENDNPKFEEYKFYVTYMNKHGKNPYYAQWGTYLSIVGNNTFFNIGDSSKILGEGYFFVRIIDMDKTGNKMTTAKISDTSLASIKSSSKLRKVIEKNINNSNFYSDTLHFYKVDNYHLDINFAISRANK